MKQLIFVLVFMLVLAACGSGGGDNKSSDTGNGNTNEGSGGEGTVSLDLAHAAAEAHPFHKGVLKFVELVDEKSNGEIEINVFPNRQLGDEREGLENNINGTVEMGLVSSPIFSLYTPIFDAIQLPFLLNTYDIEEQAFQTDAMQKMLDSLEEVGLKGLGITEGGMRHIANTVRPVSAPEDLKGLKLRTVETPLMQDVFNALGASPTPMAYGEVYTSLETGVLDGEEVNLTTITAERHYEILEHVTLTGQNPFPAIYIVNLDVFNELSEEHQNILVEAARESSTYMFEEIKQADEEALEVIKGEGIEVVEMSDADVENFKSQVKEVYEKYMAKDPLIEEFVKEIEALK